MNKAINFSFKKSLLALSIGISLSLVGCGGGSSSSSNDTPLTSTATTASDSAASAFPTDVSVASPVDSDSSSFSSTSSLTALSAFDTARATTTKARIHKRLTTLFNALLAGKTTASVKLAFKPSLFFTSPGNASCYGPSMSYTGHPDAGSSSADGNFPSGDLGIWVETTSTTGEACAASQLNSRMKGIRNQTMMGMMGLASLITVYQSTGKTFPTDISAGSTVTLTTEMNALGISSVNFVSATIGLDSTGKLWNYALELTYTDSTSTAHTIKVALQHSVTSATAKLYEGLLTYQVETKNNGGNCNTTTFPMVTQQGSLHYKKSLASKVTMQSRTAQACGTISTGTNLLNETVSSSKITGKVVDPSASWSDNFNAFTAQFNPDDLIGRFNYVWQAGNGDSHTRVLDINMKAADAGDAYFGFGNKVQTKIDSEILGMICNWAGPGNSHTPTAFAQRQHMVMDSTTATFKPVADGAEDASDITYAPTNSCQYTKGSGSFDYDRDLNSTLDTSDKVEINSSSTPAFDLLAPSGTATTIWDEIKTNRGFTPPVYP